MHYDNYEQIDNDWRTIASIKEIVSKLMKYDEVDPDLFFNLDDFVGGEEGRYLLAKDSGASTGELSEIQDAGKVAEERRNFAVTAKKHLETEAYNIQQGVGSTALVLVPDRPAGPTDFHFTKDSAYRWAIDVYNIELDGWKPLENSKPNTTLKKQRPAKSQRKFTDNEQEKLDIIISTLVDLLAEAMSTRNNHAKIATQVQKALSNYQDHDDHILLFRTLSSIKGDDGEYLKDSGANFSAIADLVEKRVSSDKVSVSGMDKETLRKRFSAADDLKESYR